MPEFYRLDMPKEEINKTLLTAVLYVYLLAGGSREFCGVYQGRADC